MGKSSLQSLPKHSVIVCAGNYMAMWGYKISLRVLKNISRVSAANEWNIFFQHEKRNFVSPSNHVMFYLLYKHQWNAKPFYLNSFLVWRCGLLWSHSNGDIFTCEEINFSCESSLCISLVFIMQLLLLFVISYFQEGSTLFSCSLPDCQPLL